MPTESAVGSGDVAHEGGGLDVEATGKFDDSVETGVPDASFDASDLGLVEPCGPAESFLCQTSLLACLADVVGEDLAVRWLVGRRHAVIVAVGLRVDPANLSLESVRSPGVGTPFPEIRREESA